MFSLQSENVWTVKDAMAVKETVRMSEVKLDKQTCIVIDTKSCGKGRQLSR